MPTELDRDDAISRYAILQLYMKEGGLSRAILLVTYYLLILAFTAALFTGAARCELIATSYAAMD